MEHILYVLPLCVYGSAGLVDLVVLADIPPGRELCELLGLLGLGKVTLSHSLTQPVGGWHPALTQTSWVRFQGERLVLSFLSSRGSCFLHPSLFVFVSTFFSPRLLLSVFLLWGSSCLYVLRHFYTFWNSVTCQFQN